VQVCLPCSEGHEAARRLASTRDHNSNMAQYMHVRRRIGVLIDSNSCYHRLLDF
jgi:translation elongation factor EF-Ts